MTSFFEITEDTFQQEVLSSVEPVLLEFGAPWCVPCRNLEPILTQLSSGVWAGKVRLLKVNVDECPGLVNRFSVMTVPTLILFVSGQPVERLTGLQTAAKITQKLDPYITNPASRA